MTPAFSIDTSGHTFDPDKRVADPPASERRAAAALRDLYRTNPPGAPTDNRINQARHFTEIVYICISRIMRLASGSSYEVAQKKKRNGNRTTFGPGNHVVKSHAASQAQGRDDDYSPLEDDDHPLCRMIQRPNPNETFGELSAKLVLQNRLTGVGPLWTIPNEKRRPVELWSLKTPLMYPVYQQSREYPNGAWRIIPYQTHGMGFMPRGIGVGGATIPGEEVKRFMEPHPFIDWDGYSALTAGAKSLDVLDSISEARKTSMDRGVVLGTYVLVPGANQEELDRIVKDMAQNAGGSRNHRAFQAFGFGSPESKGTINTETQRPVDMEYESGWEQMTSFCLALFGVPKSVAGLQQSGSYSEHYAARQQFYDEQADYLNSYGIWLTKTLAWPWCSFPDEYLIRVKPRPINDHELAEKQHARQDQNGTITYDESRAKDDELPWHDPEIGKLPVPVALAVIEQQAMAKYAPQPQPGMVGPDGQPVDPNAAGAGAPGGGEEMPQDGEGLAQAITSEAIATLGVPDEDAPGTQQGLQAGNQPPGQPTNGQPVQKAFTGTRGRWDESKHKRDKGKFSSTGWSGLRQAGPQQARWQQYQGQQPPDERWGQAYVDKLNRQAPPPFKPTAGGGPPPLPGQGQRPTPPPLQPRAQHATPPRSAQEHQQRIKQSAPRVATMAGAIPEGADVLASAGRWAQRAADQHADRVAAHLGIDRNEAHALIRTTIEQLCNVAGSINKTGTAQKTVRGASGKRLKFAVQGGGPRTQSGKVKTDNRMRGGPTGGAVPRPANPAGRGSRPPLPGGMKAVDAMSGLDDAAGGFLVPETMRVRKRRKKRRGVGAYLKKALEELEG